MRGHPNASRRIAALLAVVAGATAFEARAVALPEVAFRDEHRVVRLKRPEAPTVRARIRVPKQPGVAKLPAVLVFGGFEEAGKVLDLFDPSQPAIVASFDYPFSPPRKLEFPSSLALLPVARHTVHDTLDGIRALVTELLDRPDVDPSRITIVGASLGSPFALLAAGSDSRVSGLVLIHGFGDVARTAEARLMQTLGRRYPAALARPTAWLVANAAWAYGGLGSPEAAARALRPEQRVLVLEAIEDSFIPRDVSASLWSSIEASSAGVRVRRQMPGDHLQPGSGSLLREIQGIVDGWMAESRLL